MSAGRQPATSAGIAWIRYLRTPIVALAAVLAFTSPALAQWPTACVDLNDIVEAHLGNTGNVGIYQRTFDAGAEAACQSDHRDDVRAVFAWAFDAESAGPMAPTPWPSTCVALNDIVEAHLGNTGNVQIYQRAFGAGPAAEAACQRDHRQDVRGLFAWAFGGAPASRWLSVSAGDNHSCGIRIDGTVACWGKGSSGQASPPTGAFSSVSTGYAFTCGVRADGRIACWGSNSDGQATPPPGKFVSVSTGFSHACGVRQDGNLLCWGVNTSGQTRTPSGLFTSVSSSTYHGCAVRRNGRLACWGENSSGEATPPSDSFTSVSVGLDHSCGLRRDGTIACWGSNENDKATPPPGIFTSVTTRSHHTCGVRPNGSVACWGSDAQSLITPPARRFQIAQRWLVTHLRHPHRRPAGLLEVR